MLFSAVVTSVKVLSIFITPMAVTAAVSVYPQLFCLLSIISFFHILSTRFIELRSAIPQGVLPGFSKASPISKRSVMRCWPKKPPPRSRPFSPPEATRRARSGPRSGDPSSRRSSILHVTAKLQSARRSGAVGSCTPDDIAVCARDRMPMRGRLLLKAMEEGAGQRAAGCAR